MLVFYKWTTIIDMEMSNRQAFQVPQVVKNLLIKFQGNNKSNKTFWSFNNFFY